MLNGKTVAANGVETVEALGRYRLAIYDHDTGQVHPVEVWLPAGLAVSPEVDRRFQVAILPPGHGLNGG